MYEFADESVKVPAVADEFVSVRPPPGRRLAVRALDRGRGRVRIAPAGRRHHDLADRARAGVERAVRHRARAAAARDVHLRRADVAVRGRARRPRDVRDALPERLLERHRAVGGGLAVDVQRRAAREHRHAVHRPYSRTEDGGVVGIGLPRAAAEVDERPRPLVVAVRLLVVGLLQRRRGQHARVHVHHARERVRALAHVDPRGVGRPRVAVPAQRQRATDRVELARRLVAPVRFAEVDGTAAVERAARHVQFAPTAEAQALAAFGRERATGHPHHADGRRVAAEAPPRPHRQRSVHQIHEPVAVRVSARVPVIAVAADVAHLAAILVERTLRVRVVAEADPVRDRGPVVHLQDRTLRTRILDFEI